MLGADSANPATLRRFETGGRELPGLGSEDSTIRYVTTVDQCVLYVGASPVSLPEIVSVHSATGTRSVLKKSNESNSDKYCFYSDNSLYAPKIRTYGLFNFTF